MPDFGWPSRIAPEVHVEGPARRLSTVQWTPRFCRLSPKFRRLRRAHACRMYRMRSEWGEIIGVALSVVSTQTAPAPSPRLWSEQWPSPEPPAQQLKMPRLPIART